MEPALMNDDAARPAKKGYRFLISCVLCAVVGLIAINLFSDWLNENQNVNPAIANLANLAVPTLLCIFCGVYLLLFRRGGLATWIGLGALSLPVAVFGTFQPVFNGDAQVVRWENRFAQTQRDWDLPAAQTVGAETKLAAADGAAVADAEAAKNDSPITLVVDLKTETPFDFQRFLGRNSNATIDNVELENWETSQPKEIWKQPIGRGWSGFAVVNGFAVTQEQRSERECVTCYKVETGKLLWNYAVDRRHEDTMGMGKPGPRATPTIHEGRVYAVSATGVLDCLDGSNGELLWSANVPELVGIEQVESTNSAGLKYTEETSTLAWGRSTSPLIYRQMVIVPGGSVPTRNPAIDKAATLIAFDKISGEIIWRGGKRMIAYGSPVVKKILGRDQILLTAEDHGVGHDPETGEELWSIARPGQSNAAANCSEVTAISDDVLLFSKGYSAGGETVKISFNDSTQKWSATSIDKDPRILKTKLTSPVVFEDHLYSLSDGYLECVRIDGLKRKWKKRGRYGNGQLLLVGDRLLVHSEFGTLNLVEANSEKFIELGAVQTIDGICWNTLCLADDLLLVRSDLEAACYRLPTREK